MEQGVVGLTPPLPRGTLEGMNIVPNRQARVLLISPIHRSKTTVPVDSAEVGKRYVDMIIESNIEPAVTEFILQERGPDGWETIQHLSKRPADLSDSDAPSDPY